MAYGPLRIDPDGLEWDRKHYKWDEIEDYEVRVGYLRIQTARDGIACGGSPNWEIGNPRLERLNAKFEVGESLSSEEQHQAKPLAKLPPSRDRRKKSGSPISTNGRVEVRSKFSSSQIPALEWPLSKILQPWLHRPGLLWFEVI